MMLLRSLAPALAVCIGIALPISVAAQQFGTPPSADTPVEITADGLSISRETGAATFSGNVVIAQGPLRLAADEVTVIYVGDDRSKVSSLTADGHVTLSSGEDGAEAQRAEYDIAAGEVRLSGDVMLVQGPNILAGERMVLNLETGAAQVEGRVRSVIDPAQQ